MMKLCPLVLFLLAGSLVPLRARDIGVADVVALHEAIKVSQPGDAILMQSGVWKDADLLFKTSGRPGEPITLKAGEPGKVILTGKSRLRIAGEHLVVQDLWFQDIADSGEDIIQFRGDSKTLSSNCFLQHCALSISGTAEQVSERKWVSLYGFGNKVEHCHFEGKKSPGTLLVVWLPEKQGHAPGHSISQNYFGARPRLGKNGGEIIRIGDSKTSMQNARCEVTDNFFEHCDGEAECISNKSCENIYQGNFFLECQGTLTLRHGNRCLVEGNTFVGNHVQQTGGIRVIGEDHKVINNRLDSLAGDETRAAICLMNGIQDSPQNGYFQVQRALIKGNVMTDCKESFCIGYADEDVKATLPPVMCVLKNNQADAGESEVVFLRDSKADLHWEGNVFSGKRAGAPQAAGIVWGRVEIAPVLPPKRNRAGPRWWSLR